MADFDPQDVISTTPPPRGAVAPPQLSGNSGQSGGQVGAAGGDFDPSDVISTSPPPRNPPPQAQNNDFDEADLHKPQVAARTNAQSDFDPADVISSKPANAAPKKNLLLSQTVTDDEIQKIATKYGVDADNLKSIAPYFSVGIQPTTPGEAVSTGAKAVAGEIGQTVGLGVPQFIYKKMQDEPTRKAIDELRDLGEQKQSSLENVTQFGRQLAAPLPVGAELGAAGRIGTAAGIGAVAGTTGSREGQEIRGAAQGAVAGGALGVGAEAVGAGLGLLGKLADKRNLSRSEVDLVSRGENTPVDLYRGTQDIASKTADSEDIIQKTLLERDGAIPKGTTDVILKEQMEPETVQKYLDPSTDEGQAIRKEIGSTDPDEIHMKLAQDVVENRAIDFAESLTKKTPEDYQQALDVIDEQASRRGQPYIQEKYKDFVQQEQAERYLRDSGDRVIRDQGFYSRAGDFASDSQYVLRDIDRRTGGNGEAILRDLNKQDTKSRYILNDYMKRVQSLYDANKKLGADPDALYEAMSSGKTQELPPELQQAAQNIESYFRDLQNFVSNKISERDPTVTPMKPAPVDGLPHMAIQYSEAVPRIEKEMRTVLGSSGKPNFESLSPAELKQAPLDNIRSALELVDLPSNSGRDIDRGLDQLLNGRDGANNYSQATRNTAETGKEIPDFLLEKDPYKLITSYTNNTIRDLYMSRGLSQLRNYSRVLQKAGDNQGSGYVSRLVQDAQGVRPGTAAAAQRSLSTNYYRTLDRMIDQAGGPETRLGGFLTGAKAAPDVIGGALRSIYPNAMGMNIHTLLLNSSGSFTKLAPELGGTYGAQTVLKSLSKVLMNLPKEIERVRQSGLIIPGNTYQAELDIAEGIQRSALWKIPQKTLQGLAKFSMSLHQGVEILNRAVAYNAGDILAKEVAAGSPSAIQALNRFPLSLRREVTANPDRAGDVLGKFLSDTTAYNYNRLSMSEYGRTMGPLFSAFTKWPTATLGDVLANFREKGMVGGSVRNAEKYLAPITLFGLGDYLMGKKFGTDDRTDREKLVFGGRGLLHMAPGMSLVDIARGEVGMPPAAAMAYHGIIKPALEGETPDARKSAGEFVQSFGPGSWILRFLTQDVVTATTGRKPQGSDFFEKTDNGMKQIAK